MANDESADSTAVGPISDLLRAPTGPIDLRAYDTRATPGFDGDKNDAAKLAPKIGDELSDLQERLFADGQAGGHRSVLLVLQGMDTSGKGGTLRHVVGLMDPQGVRITSFKAPTMDELAHNFLWRIRNALPKPGIIGVFDRSHYEDVLIVRVRNLVPEAEWSGRYEAINSFEQELVSAGVTVIKVMLHISPDEQRERLLERLDNPDKYWKYNPGDVDERSLWPAYRVAYEAAIEKCAAAVPWHIVPADRKWYRNWAIASLLREHLRALDLGWPPADFDVAHERARLAAT